MRDLLGCKGQDRGAGGPAEQPAELPAVRLWSQVIGIPEEQEAQQGMRWSRGFRRAGHG